MAPGGSAEAAVVWIEATDTHRLRRDVLRLVGDGAERFPEDEGDGTRHLGVQEGGRLVAVVSVTPQRAPWDKASTAVRFYGLAVSSGRQGRGLGRLLVRKAIAHAAAARVDLLWANGRESSIGFYMRLGFRTQGDGWLNPRTGLVTHWIVRAAGVPFAESSEDALVPDGRFETTIPRDFLEAVARFGPRLAVQDGERSFTYAELGCRVGGVARLVGARAGADSTGVALFLPLGSLGPVATLGTLAAGRFYVPLDPALPADGNAAFLSDSRCRLVLTDREHGGAARTMVAAAGGGAQVAYVEDAGEAPLEEPSGGDGPGDLACVVYTSGSMGEPKGVCHSHRSILHGAAIYRDEIGAGPDDRFSLLHGPSFIAYATGFYAAILSGACLLPFRVPREGLDRLADWISEERITVLHMVPTLFRRLGPLLEGRLPAAVRFLRLGGEAVSGPDVRLFRKTFRGPAALLVGLGSTEALGITSAILRAGDDVPAGTVPVGTPAPGKEVFLLDPHGNEVETGETGEVVVRSRYLFHGYHRRPGLTAGVLSQDPEDASVWQFRTGDLGMRDERRRLVHRGRLDDGTKVRGQRVHLADVEAALRASDGVVDAVVEPFVGHDGDTRLAAWVVPGRNMAPGTDHLRRRLRATLPGALVPATIRLLDELPVTRTGKVDRLALLHSLPASARERQLSAPRIVEETAIAGLFAEVLGAGPVGPDDDFFELGGDSLLALDLVSRLERRFPSGLRPADLLESPSPAGLAARIAGERDGARSAVTLRSGADGPPLFVVPGALLDDRAVLLAGRLVRHLPPGLGVVAFRRDPGGPPIRSLDEVAAALLGPLTERQPRGPYRLLGDCSGGFVAHEMARRLAEEGEVVELLALLDTEVPAPPWSARGLAAPARRKMEWIWGRVRHHLRQVGAEPIGPKGRYLLEKAWIAARTLAGPSSRQPADRAYLRAVRRWRPRPSRVPMTLLLTEDFARRQVEVSWDERLAPGLRVVPLPGSHSARFRQCVKETGAAVREALERSTPSEMGTGSPCSDLHQVNR